MAKWSTEVVETHNTKMPTSVRFIIQNDDDKSIEVFLSPRDATLIAMHLTSAAVGSMDINDGRVPDK